MWLAKIKRMMDELPEQYLQPKPVDPEAMMLIPPGSKPVSQLTEEEMRLNGVARQLNDTALLEHEAHIALYGQDESEHPLEACRKHNEQIRSRDEELEIVLDILIRSFKERLGFENEYIIDGYDIYVIAFLTVEVMEPDTDTKDEPASMDGVGIPGFRGWPKTES